MDRTTAGLFKRHPLFRTRDPEEVDAYLCTFGYKLDVRPREARQLDACFNGVFLPNLALGYYHYGAQVDIRTSPTSEYYWILRPLRGQLEMIAGRVAVTCGPGRAVVVSPTQMTSFRSQTGSMRLHVRLAGAALTRRLVSLLGEPLGRPLEFAPEMIINEGYGRSLAAYLRLAIADLEEAGSLLRSPIALGSFEEFILTGLLLSHPHNYSGLLQHRQKSVTPRDVKRAIDYIEANLDTAIGLPEIAAASGVPGRTLVQHFRDFKRTSPMRYLRTARYKKVREALDRAVPPTASPISLRDGASPIWAGSRSTIADALAKARRRCTGVLAAACTQGKRTQHGKPHCVIRDDQPDAREGQAGRTGVAERPVVPRTPGNAGGGKGPQFKTDARRGEGPGDWAT